MASFPSAPSARVRRRLPSAQWRHVTGLLGLAAFVSMPLTAASAAVIYVDILAAGANDGSSWTDAYVDLQDALTSATAGDEIWVAQGTYRPTSGTDRTATFQLKDEVAVYGGFEGTETDRAQRDWQLQPTILSGDIGVPDESVFREFETLVTRRAPAPEVVAWAKEHRGKNVTDNSYHVVTGSGTDASAVLDGFTITRGAAEGMGLDGDGGGMLNVAGDPTLADVVFLANTAAVHGGGMANWGGSEPTLANVQFSNWSAYVAGGMFNDGSSPTLTDVLFESNVATVSGGGMHNRGGSEPVLTSVTFSANGADDVGGGMTNVASSPMLVGVSFLANSAGSAGGGGMANQGGSEPTLLDVTFDGNVTLGPGLGGGGMLNLQSHPNLLNVSFVGNASAANEGGGGMANYASHPMLANAVFLENSTVAFGGGMANHDGSEPQLVSTTFSRNFTTFTGGWGGAIYNLDSTPTLVNSICWGDSSGPGREEIFNDASVPVISSSLIEGSGGSGGWDSSLGLDGGANLDADPLFVDAPGGDLRLTSGSPAVDTGCDDAVTASTDLDGNARVTGAAVDLGAYELACAPLSVVFGTSTTGPSLQDVLDAEYGPGQIDAEQDHLAALCAAGDFPYWLDGAHDAWIVNVLASNGLPNEFGWHVEDFRTPGIDGIDDGVILDGVIAPGATTSALMPAGFTRFGFYLNPNGPGDADGAPEPEIFFLNRVYNDAGPDGGGDLRPPDGGDPQCVVYDVSRFYHDRPTFVLAWEDADYGVPLPNARDSLATGYLFQDLVLEIKAMRPVFAVTSRLTAESIAAGVELRWAVEGVERLDRLEIRRDTGGAEVPLVSWGRGAILPRGTWIDRDAVGPASYRLIGVVDGIEASSTRAVLDAPAWSRPRLLGVTPNPFNPATRVAYSLPVDGPVALAVYDLTGRRVRRLIEATKSAGDHWVSWDGRDEAGGRVASGVYIVQLQAGFTLDARRLVLLK